MLCAGVGKNGPKIDFYKIMEYPESEGTHEDIPVPALTRASLHVVQGPFQEGVGCTLRCKSPHPAVTGLL